jgi:CxxC motif-containing protein (DUF1111 family)
MRWMSTIALLVALCVLQWLTGASTIDAQMRGARDPGVRGGSADAGGPVGGLATGDQRVFEMGREDFKKVEGVGRGLGPRFNLDNCGGCHAQPALGGTAPALNPQVAVATAFGARNAVPSFITPNGPARVARFKFHPDGRRDGSVHALFVVTGRVDNTGSAQACSVKQEDFETQIARGNVVFRIATPAFGAGLIEQVPDRVILANQDADSSTKRALGITGHPNRNDHDGTIARFGWKAQNNSLLLFSGEAYAVELGITNELFPTEREDHPTCQSVSAPNEFTASDLLTGADGLGAIGKFSFFTRLLAPPTPSATSPGGSVSIAKGRTLFATVGCALCHTPTLKTGNAAVAALRHKDVSLFSDLLVHAMGPALADDIVQGEAGPDEFRTAPLWGLGKRIFFLHDGRTTNLLEAIDSHRSIASGKFRASEANAVIDRFNALAEADKQHVLNFLRSL